VGPATRVGTGPAPDRTRPDEKFIRPDETGFLPVHPAERNRIFAGSLPDFCRIFVSLTSKMNRTDFTGFLSIFLPDFCQFDAKNEPAGFQPDRTGQILNPAGPGRMEKTSPVPTLRATPPPRFWSKAFSK
jgi:hypothetical protein